MTNALINSAPLVAGIEDKEERQRLVKARLSVTRTSGSSTPLMYSRALASPFSVSAGNVDSVNPPQGPFRRHHHPPRRP